MNSTSKVPPCGLITAAGLLALCLTSCAQPVADSSNSTATPTPDTNSAGEPAQDSSPVRSETGTADGSLIGSGGPAPATAADRNSPTDGVASSERETFVTDPNVDAFERLKLAKQYLPQQSRAIQLATAGQMTQASQLLEQITREAPFLPTVRYNLACVLALQGQTERALQELEAAIRRGFTDVALIRQDSDLQSLRDRPKFPQLLQLAEQLAEQELNLSAPQPAVIENQFAKIAGPQAVFDTRFNFVQTDIDWEQRPEFQGELPIVGFDEVGEQLRKWYAEGTAAGNWGDLYDNCDRNHSRHKHQNFPTLTRLQYDKSIRKLVPYGLQTELLHDGIVVGNSSTAATGNPLWRSNTRMAYCSPASMRRLHKQYRSNHLYLYPEHTDYDRKHGDVFPANTPYVLTSNGSSGSDRPFMNALFCTLAAFRPEVKEKLREEDLIAPTLQWIFRSSNKNVPDQTTYLSGVAHPPVFASKQLDVMRMIQMAHELDINAIPPLVVLQVEEEDQGKVGVDYFDVAERTKLFDTPQAVARVYRTLQPQTRMVVSVEESFDVNGHPLTFHWKVLNQGDKSVEIRPLNQNATRAEIIVPYTPKHPVSEGNKLQTCRVEIGVFAHNGKNYSAPAFVTFYTLANEKREYDASGRLLSVTYKGGTDEGPYADPLIDAPKTWRDEYQYTSDGQLLGWTRHLEDRQDEFTRDGLLVRTRDAEGRPETVELVRYFPVPLKLNPMVRLDYKPADTTFRYQYQNANDQLGTLQRQ